MLELEGVVMVEVVGVRGCEDAVAEGGFTLEGVFGVVEFVWVEDIGVRLRFEDGRSLFDFALFLALEGSVDVRKIIETEATIFGIVVGGAAWVAGDVEGICEVEIVGNLALVH